MAKKQHPAEGAGGASAVPLATNTADQLYLFGFATQREVIHHLRTRIAATEEKSQAEVISQWRKSQQKVKTLIETESGLAQGINFTNLDPAEHPSLKKIADSELYKKSYFALPNRFALVEVDRLIAPQRHVNMDHVKKIQARVPKNASLAQLIEVTLAAGSGVEPIQHMEVSQNFHVFSSQSADFRFLGAFLKDLTPEDVKFAELGGVPATAIIAFVGYGASEVNVYEVGNKMILNNGFHRVFALRQLGYKKIPVLVQEIRNPSLEISGSILGVSSNYLLNHQRPALLKDFFDKDLTITLKIPRSVRTVKLRVATEQYDVPV